MKNAFLSLAITLACSSLAASSYASGDEYYEHGGRYEYGSPSYEGKFYGPVESMPSGGIFGMWRIGGREVLVTERTFIKEEYGRIGVGAQVEVKGGGNPFAAYEIEVKNGGRIPSTPVPPPPAMMGGLKFYGPVEGMPQAGREGMWRIGGRDVVVTPSTLIKEEYGRLGIGVSVEVKGSGNPFTAYEIEVKGIAR